MNSNSVTKAILIDDCSPYKEELEKKRIQSGYIDRFTYPFIALRKAIVDLVSESLTLDIDIQDVNLNAVPENYAGDLSLELPAVRKQDAKSYIKTLVPKLVTLLVEHKESLKLIAVDQKGPYINLSLDPNCFVKEVLGLVNEYGSEYGQSNLYENQNLMIDFSSPNMGKSLHVGHVGTTLLGAVLSNIYEAVGHTVFRVNHLGDWGTPVGFLKVGEERFGDLQEVKELRDSPAKYYSALYANALGAAKEDEGVRDQAKDFFASLESGSEEMVKFWERVRTESITELEAIYRNLNIYFDLYLGEAAYESNIEYVVKEALNLNFVNQDDRAVVIDLEDKNLGTALLKKSDAATTYMARDLAAIYSRKKVFGLDKTVYVVGTEQRLHFQQLFFLAKELGYMPDDSMVYVPIGLLTQNGKKISSRAGTGLAFESLLQNVKQFCVDRMQAKEDHTHEEVVVDQVSGLVADAALYYSQIQISPGKNSEFSIDRITDTKGKSGPSLQYTAVRIKSILDKIGEPNCSFSEIPDSIWANLDPACFKVLRKVAFYQEVLESCAQKNTAHLFAVYLDELKELVTGLIYSVVFRDTEGLERDAYNHVLRAIYTVVANGLSLMNCKVPKVM